MLIQVNSINLNVVNIHAPNVISACKTFFEHLNEYFLSHGDLVIAGDFNCVDNPLDRLTSTVYASNKKCLRALQGDFCLSDVWRKRNPSVVVFTWSNNDHSQASRLDRFIISRSLLIFLCSNDVLLCAFSDHNY